MAVEWPRHSLPPYSPSTVTEPYRSSLGARWLAWPPAPCEPCRRMIVIVYGYDGSGPGHWQRWLESELPPAGAGGVSRAARAAAAAEGRLGRGARRRRGAAAATPVTFVCHSLGCWAVDHLLAERGRGGRACGAAGRRRRRRTCCSSRSKASCRRRGGAPRGRRSRRVHCSSAATTTSSLRPTSSRRSPAPLAVRCQIIPGAGHINTASGYGPWPFVARVAGVGRARALLPEATLYLVSRISSLAGSAQQPRDTEIRFARYVPS